MHQRYHASRTALLIGALAGLALTHPAYALQPTGFLPGAEAFMAGLFNFILGMVIPAAGWGALLALAFNFFFAWFQLTKKAIGLIAGLGLLGGGLPWISQWTGGVLATSLTL